MTYKEAKDDVLDFLKSNASEIGVKESAIIESGDEPSALPSPFVYCVFDFGESHTQGGFVIELEIEIYVGTKAKNAAIAKEKADEIASKILALLVNNGKIRLRNKFKEFFAESATRAGVRIFGIRTIRSH